MAFHSNPLHRLPVSPIQTLVCTVPVGPKQWESNIICPYCISASILQHYKTTGQYHIHLNNAHPDEAAKVRAQYESIHNNENIHNIPGATTDMGLGIGDLALDQNSVPLATATTFSASTLPADFSSGSFLPQALGGSTLPGDFSSTFSNPIPAATEGFNFSSHQGPNNHFPQTFNGNNHQDSFDGNFHRFQ
ncbi:hypothetical protein HD806DRAFT_447129 [Xylariaceae sp. AK1471]|nr:hypothetical protein HD806DRAFT_447129 [Xylariaceae sp. AK1471]